MNISDWKSLPEAVIKVFRKYRIISKQEIGEKVIEGYTTANLRRARDAEGRILGDGPLIAQDVLARMIHSCTYQDKVMTDWLEWIIFQAGGGQEAQRRANQAMEQVKERFLDERVRGYRDTKGVYHNPITREQAEAKWNASHGRFNEVLYVGDQDMAEKLQVFGFYRHWPGPNKIYEKACTNVKGFLDLTEKTVEMNEFMRRSGMKEKIVPLDLKHYTTVDSLQQAIAKIERFFNSRAAREDIRIEQIYEDDIVQAICPLTFSAAVRYGWDSWGFANRGTFEQCLEGSNNWNDPWKKTTGTDKKVIVYFNFRVPMPSWVGYAQQHFKRFTLHNVCALLPMNQLGRLNHDACEFLDEEQRKTTITAICELIRAEPHRVPDPDGEEYPIQQGPPVYEKSEEAEAVVEAFEKAWDAVTLWAAKFPAKQIVVEYMPKSSGE
jgi:hypothetical protein